MREKMKRDRREKEMSEREKIEIVVRKMREKNQNQ